MKNSGSSASTIFLTNEHKNKTSETKLSLKQIGTLELMKWLTERKGWVSFGFSIDKLVELSKWQ